jgi:hypothetical protein
VAGLHKEQSQYFGHTMVMKADWVSIAAALIAAIAAGVAVWQASLARSQADSARRQANAAEQQEALLRQQILDADREEQRRAALEIYEHGRQLHNRLESVVDIYENAAPYSAPWLWYVVPRAGHDLSVWKINVDKLRAPVTDETMSSTIEQSLQIGDELRVMFLALDSLVPPIRHRSRLAKTSGLRTKLTRLRDADTRLYSLAKHLGKDPSLGKE